MKGLNRVFLMGHLGAQPELRHSQNGEAYTRLSIANNYRPKDTGEEITDWFNVMVWGAQATNAAKYLNKGSGVMVEAYLDTFTRETEAGGTEKLLGLKARSLQFLPRNKSLPDKD